MRGFQQDKSLLYCFEHYYSPHLSHFNFALLAKINIETFFLLSHNSFIHSLFFFLWFFSSKSLFSHHIHQQQQQQQQYPQCQIDIDQEALETSNVVVIKVDHLIYLNVETIVIEIVTFLLVQKAGREG